MKERDDVPEEPIYVAPKEDPMTDAAFRALRARLDALPEGDERRHAERALARAIVIDAPGDTGVVSFGATVGVDGVATRIAFFTIVAENDVDVPAGRIGLTSPLARALLGKREGEKTVWHRPDGDRPLRIASVAFTSRPI